MGVKDLWGLVSPIGEVLPFTELEGTIVAIDLAPWVVDSQNVNMGKVTRPHLRNLLWRTLRLLDSGVLPLFVLEGDAPSLKWDTINKRNQQNFGHGKEPAKATVKTGNRSQFKRVQKECANLLDLLGVPWVQASGEAEATCAALNYHKVVSGVITQDSDVFLYGGETVFRNFTASQSKATVEKFCMSGIVEHLGVNRSGLLVLSILLGCDYLPAGISGVGKETAIRMIREWYQQGITDSLDRICKWSLEDEDNWRDINPKKWKTGSLLELEAGVRSRALATNGFPFMDIIKEFKTNIRIPSRNFKWRQPQMKELMRWCIIKLDWEPDYALDKVAPVVSRWIMVNISPQKPLPTNYVPEMQAVRCVKKCVRGGVASMAVEWHVVDNEKFPCSIPAYVTTDEPVVFISESAPQLIEQFEAEIKAKKKGKSRASRKKKSEEVLDQGIASMNLDTKVENKKSTRRKVVKANTKVKPITDYLQPKNKVEDIVKEHKEEFKSEENVENTKKKNHPLCLQDRATVRLKENITNKENHVIQTDVKNKEISSSKNVKNKEISSSKKVEKLSDKEISSNEFYDMQSLNDDDLAELSGMLRKLEMVHECQSNHILNSKEDEQYIKECESRTNKESHTNESPTNNGCNFDLTLGNDESLNNNFDESRNINNLSEIINRMSENPISLIDKNKDLNLSKTHLNENASNSNNQMQQKDEKSNFNSMISRNETHQNNDNKSNPDAPIYNKNVSFIEERILKSINIPKTMKPTLSSLKDDVNCKQDKSCDSEESLKNISSDNLNRTNISSDHSNYTEESWQDDDDIDFELSMIINRITGLRMGKDNSCKSQSTKAINTVKGFKILKSDEERNNVSDKDISVSLNIKSKTKINAEEFMKTDLKKIETQKKSESDLKKSSCWDYFTPISERQDNKIPLPSDKIFISQPKYNTGNSVCNKIETNIPKEIEKHSQEHLIGYLKHQASSKMVHAGNMATDIIRSSLKNSSELSTFGNSLSDSILAAATADSMIFDKTENSKNQCSFDLFEDSCDSEVNKQTTKYSSNYKSENLKKGIILNLPKHHSTPSVDCIAPRRILNQKSQSNTPSCVKNSQGNDLKFPSPVFVSSPAQTSFISDFGSPFPTHSPLNDIVKESFPCTNKGFDTPISSKTNRNQISNHTTSKTDSNLSVSSSDHHQERSSKVCAKKYECKSSDKPKYKVREDQLCFKLFDSFSNSGINISTSLSEIQKDSPSSAELKENCMPKWAPTDCDTMSILFPNKCLGNVKLEVVPEENVSSINDKEKRKPLTGLVESDSNVNVLHNNERRVIDGTSLEEKHDLQKKLKSSDIIEDNSLHIKKGKENKESNMNIVQVFDKNYNTENETNINSFSKYRDVSTFSPVVLSQYVSLADRLKAKCKDKAMEKLLDQL